MVAVGRGIILGTVEESSYGAGGTPDRFHRVNSEQLKPQRERIDSAGLGGDASLDSMQLASLTVATTRAGAGPIVMEVPTSGFGRILKHATGNSTGPVSGAQTHKPGNLSGKSLGVQVQFRDPAGSVLASFMARGLKIFALTLENDAKGILLATLDTNFQYMERSTPAAVANYPAVEVFQYQQGSVKLDGVLVAKITKYSGKLTNNLEPGGPYLGSGGLQDEPTRVNRPAMDGSLTSEFVGPTTFYDRFDTDTPALLETEWIGTSSGKKMKIAVAQVRFNDGAPSVNGPGRVSDDYGWTGWNDGTSDLTITYTSPDSAI